MSEQLLTEIRNLLEFMVRRQHFGVRSVPSEGGPSWEAQERGVEAAIGNIKKFGDPNGNVTRG